MYVNVIAYRLNPNIVCIGRKLSLTNLPYVKHTHTHKHTTLTWSPDASGRARSTKVDAFAPFAEQVLDYFAIAVVYRAMNVIFRLRRVTALYKHRQTRQSKQLYEHADPHRAHAQ